MKSKKEFIKMMNLEEVEKVYIADGLKVVECMLYKSADNDNEYVFYEDDLYTVRKIKVYYRIVYK